MGLREHSVAISTAEFHISRTSLGKYITRVRFCLIDDADTHHGHHDLAYLLIGDLLVGLVAPMRSQTLKLLTRHVLLGFYKR